MEETGLPHLDINSFPTVNAALKTKLKVIRSLKIIKKSNQKRQVLNSWHQHLIVSGVSPISRAITGLSRTGKLKHETLHKTPGHAKLEGRGAKPFLSHSLGFSVQQ